ncbi:MAG: mandelate racemase/muconate lactonizing enzyme family protein [Rhodospirillales bacterium]|nr:mandelate racemase/muconate lactonizing enzyme family protein [Rhodospirillales bacterium]
MKPHFIGREIWDRDQIWHRLYDENYHLGLQNQMTAGLSAINIALLDILGKSAGEPLCKLLGGQRLTEIPAYASTGFFTPDPLPGLERQMKAIVGQGFGATKIKIGRSPADDEARVKRTREIIGPDMLVMVDVNANYTVDATLDSARRIAPYGIHWYEEPLPPTDFEGYREVRALSPIRIATGEALYTAHDLKRLIDGRGVDFVQPDLTMCGGLEEGRLIAKLAYLANLKLTPHVWGGAVGLAAAVHFVAALPASPQTDIEAFPNFIEYDRSQSPLRDDLAVNPLVFKNGRIAVPTAPGLGIELDMKAVERYRI